MRYYFKCPKCGRDDVFHIPSEEPMRRGFLSPMEDISIFERRRVQCGRCRHPFYQPAAPWAGVAVLAFWVLGIVVLFAGLGGCLILWPENVPNLAAYPIAGELKALVVANPGAVMLSVVLMMGVLMVLMPIVGVVSTLRNRARIQREFLTRPTRFVLGGDQNEISTESEGADAEHHEDLSDR